MKVYSLTVRHRVGAMLVALAVLGVGAALLIVGFALLAGLAVAGALVGSGIALYARLRGRERILPGEGSRAPTTLDPALEVFPARSVLHGPSTPSDEHQ